MKYRIARKNFHILCKNSNYYLIETINRNSLRYFMKGSYLVYKFFAIFIVTILWNTSALRAAVQASVCDDQSLRDCEAEAQIRSTNGNEYRCCSCTISSGTGSVTTYNCDKYADDGYELLGTYCVKTPTTSEDERGYIETSYGKCLADSTTTDAPALKLGSIMYLYKTSDGLFGRIPANCELDFDETIK